MAHLVYVYSLGLDVRSLLSELENSLRSLGQVFGQFGIALLLILWQAIIRAGPNKKDGIGFVGSRGEDGSDVVSGLELSDPTGCESPCQFGPLQSLRTCFTHLAPFFPIKNLCTATSISTGLTCPGVTDLTATKTSSFAF
jgi:hypothetical protein